MRCSLNSRVREALSSLLETYLIGSHGHGDAPVVGDRRDRWSECEGSIAWQISSASETFTRRQ